MSKEVEWLTREEIDSILDSMSADALVEAMDEGKTKGAALMRGAFNRAAESVGYESNGRTPFQRVRLADFKHLAEKLGEVVNVESPLSESTEDSLSSVASGE